MAFKWSPPYDLDAKAVKIDRLKDRIRSEWKFRKNPITRSFIRDVVQDLKDEMARPFDTETEPFVDNRKGLAWLLRAEKREEELGEWPPNGAAGISRRKP